MAKAAEYDLTDLSGGPSVKLGGGVVCHVQAPFSKWSDLLALGEKYVLIFKEIYNSESDRADVKALNVEIQARAIGLVEAGDVKDGQQIAKIIEAVSVSHEPLPSKSTQLDLVSEILKKLSEGDDLETLITCCTDLESCDQLTTQQVLKLAGICIKENMDFFAQLQKDLFPPETPESGEQGSQSEGLKPGAEKQPA